jgi:hypothetical protein
MSSDSDEDEADFRQLLAQTGVPKTMAAQRGGPHTNSIASTAVKLLGTYRGANKCKGGLFHICEWQ